MVPPIILAEHNFYVCYQLGGTLFVPHFVKTEWVGPGHFKTLALYTRDQLQTMGAIETVRALWPRIGHQPVANIEWRKGPRND